MVKAGGAPYDLGPFAMTSARRRRFLKLERGVSILKRDEDRPSLQEKGPSQGRRGVTRPESVKGVIIDHFEHVFRLLPRFWSVYS